MNVLQVSMRDLIGERFNGYRLHLSLRERGHDARMLVLYREGHDPSVQGHPRWVGPLERGLYAAERISSLQGLLSPIALTFPMRDGFRRADLVHWHLVYPHYISVPLMPFLAGRRPTVWTIHDPWPTTGHCVHPSECERWRTGCGKCPDLKRNFTVWMDTTALLWKAKRAAFRRMAVTLVAPSRWIASRAQASPLIAHWPCHVIPPGLDLGTWRLLDRADCRGRLGIPPEARTIAFRMPSGQKQQVSKGIPWLKEALRRLGTERPIHLIVFEEKGHLAEFEGRFRIHELGWLTEVPRMAEAYTAADLFLMPSVAENAPTMALEAMACGTPVIASDTTGMPEMVRAPVAGLVVPLGDAEALAQATQRLLDDDGRRAAMGAEARRIVEAEHGYDRYVDRHLALYESVLARTAGTR